MRDPTARWYVVQTQPRAEAKAATHLQRQGFETYLPRFLKRRRHARPLGTFAAPLFPRYLFVRIGRASQRWRCIHSPTGVSRLVGNGDGPAAVADVIVGGLRAREGDDGLVRLEPRRRFAQGEPV